MIQLRANNRSERIEKLQMAVNLEKLPKKKQKVVFHLRVIMGSLDFHKIKLGQRAKSVLVKKVKKKKTCAQMVI
jgi:ribosomal protein L15E